MSAIEISNLTASYAEKPVLWNISLSIPLGCFCGILGPNGSGKSTLLKSVMGLHEPDSGSVLLLNSSLELVRNKISYVPQRETVDWDFPISVLEVVKMGRYRKMFSFGSGKSDTTAALEALEMVGMSSFAKRQISQLSGGQQQRVFLARALVKNPDLYILDEPFAGIDVSSAETIFQVLQTLHLSGKTIVVVHHDLYTAARYFDQIVLLNTRLVAAGDKDQILKEENLKEAFGANLTILADMAALIKKSKIKTL